jgi:hypothetical protein
MKVGFYDTDPVGGMIPNITKLGEEKIPYRKINLNNLNSKQELDLLIMNLDGIVFLPKESLKDIYLKIKNIVESNPNEKVLIRVPGEDWIRRMDKEVGIKENIEYVTGVDMSRLTKILGEIKNDSSY